MNDHKIVVCAQPARLSALRERGFDASARVIEGMHELFLSRCAGPGVATVCEERVYAAFARTDVAEVAAAVAGLVFEASDARPPFAIGASVADDPVPLIAWRPELRSPAVGTARALASIAAPDQALVDTAFRDLAMAASAQVRFPDRENERGVLNGAVPPRRLVDLPDPVGIAVLCDMRGSSSQGHRIVNFPVLRPALKELEDITAKLMGMFRYVDFTYQRYIQSPQYTDRSILHFHVKVQLSHVESVRQLLKVREELMYEEKVTSQVANLFDYAEQLEADALQATPSQHFEESWTAFVEAVSGLHSVADGLIKEGDGTDGRFPRAADFRDWEPH